MLPCSKRRRRNLKKSQMACLWQVISEPNKFPLFFIESLVFYLEFDIEKLVRIFESLKRRKSDSIHHSLRSDPIVPSYIIVHSAELKSGHKAVLVGFTEIFIAADLRFRFFLFYILTWSVSKLGVLLPMF